MPRSRNESSDLALISVQVRESNDIDEDEDVERMEYELEERVDNFVDELSIRHDVFPDSESDDEEGSGKGKSKGKGKQKWTGEYEGYGSERRGDGFLYVGQTFYNGVDFKDAVLDYALKSGTNIKQSRWCKRKLGFDCAMRDGCKWRVYCSVVGNSNKWVIRIFNDQHTCIPNGVCELLKVPVIARLFVDQIREEPEYMMPKQIEKIIKEKWKFNASRPQCQAARNSALRWIEKEYAEQFAHLRDYAREIVSSNPGSTVEIEANQNEAGQEVFNRIFVCFDNLRRSWKENCRRLIGVDGCFLKARMKGQLLVAIGRDGDNKVYPIAWAVVQVENTENWVWFVRKLKDDLGLNDGEGFIFVSDRQKGLIKALELELPQVEHRMCVRHIYANLKSRHGKKPNMKPLVWSLAWSYNEADYEANLDRIRCYDTKVYEDVMRSKPKTWCRAFQKVGSCCEDVENNSTESFNNSVGKAREKPLVPMLEAIRRLAMVRITRRSVIANTYAGRCTPYVTRFMQKEHEKAAECRVFRSTHGMFEVLLGGCAYRVCLERRTCTCRKWDLTGIPCEHAYGVILDKKLKAEEYVEKWFHTSVWRSTYAESIVPLRGSFFWLRRDTPTMVEPPEPAQPGRKKNSNNKKDMKRKLGLNESPTKKASTVVKRVMHCRICKESGHNSRFHKKDSQSQNDDSELGGTQSQVFD